MVLYSMSAGEPLRTEEAGMAELADAQASGACGSNIVRVQVPLPAFQFHNFLRDLEDLQQGFGIFCCAGKIGEKSY